MVNWFDFAFELYYKINGFYEALLDLVYSEITIGDFSVFGYDFGGITLTFWGFLGGAGVTVILARVIIKALLV